MTIPKSTSAPIVPRRRKKISKEQFTELYCTEMKKLGKIKDPAEVKEFVDTFFVVVRSVAIMDMIVGFNGIGTFDMKRRKARKVNSPLTGVIKNIPERLALRFNVSKEFIIEGK